MVRRRIALVVLLAAMVLGAPAVPVAAASSTVWAVVIGIDDYPGRANDLSDAVADAHSLVRALTRYDVPASQQLVVTNQAADAPHVYGALDWLVAHAGPGSTAVFFFAGHVRLLHPGRQAMATADGRLISDVAFAAKLDRLRASRAWLVFASCYGGGFDEALKPGRILTAAADGNSLAYEQSELGHSYLVSYMVDQAMTQGRAPDSIESSYAWAAAALRRDHANRVPVQYDRAPGQTRLGDRRAESRAGSCLVSAGPLVGCPNG